MQRVAVSYAIAVDDAFHHQRPGIRPTDLLLHMLRVPLHLASSRMLSRLDRLSTVEREQIHEQATRGTGGLPLHVALIVHPPASVDQAVAMSSEEDMNERLRRDGRGDSGNESSDADDDEGEVDDGEDMDMMGRHERGADHSDPFAPVMSPDGTLTTHSLSTAHCPLTADDLFACRV